MFAALAHHLGAAGVPLDGDAAHRAPLDVLRLGEGEGEGVWRLAAALDEGRAVLRAGQGGVPRGGAEAAELLGQYVKNKKDCYDLHKVRAKQKRYSKYR